MAAFRLLKNGIEAFPAMFSAMDAASGCIALEMYIYADDETGREFRSHLVFAARRGVSVMVLVDAWGSRLLPDGFWDELCSAGGMVRWFRPIKKGLLPFRNHRKLLIVDNRIAFVGGVNVADEYYRGREGEPAWRDNVIEITGGEVAVLRRSFSRMWRRSVRPLSRLILRPGRRPPADSAAFVLDGGLRFLESGPGDPVQPVRMAYARVIGNAKRDISLAMGYFFPPGRVMRTLRRAVKRGVRVRVLLPEKSDVPAARWAARGLYGRLLRAGIEVWEYRPSMLHSKLAMADDTVVIGSANLDLRSARLNYELVAVVNDKQLADRARADFEEDLKGSLPIRLDAWKRRPIIQKIKERFSYWLLARADLFVARMELMRRTW